MLGSVRFLVCCGEGEGMDVVVEARVRLGVRTWCCDRLHMN